MATRNSTGRPRYNEADFLEAMNIAPEYVLRGLGIFELHAGDILTGYQGGRLWLVPSATDAGRIYEVRAGLRPERDRCECRGFEHAGHCSHLVAARRVARLSGVCDGCGRRFWNREMIEVGPEQAQASLAVFEGDVLCRSCAHAHGVL